MADLVVQVDGPLFDGRARAAIADAVDEIEWAVGADAISTVHRNLDTSIRNPTPYYETQIIMERVMGDVVVHDRDIVYGPWLEGVGSRNRTTRFKGYASFRRARFEVELRKLDLAERTLARFIPRMR